ncbi:MAG TPA: DUF1015 domain-containing protein [Candidatus Binataceae bacterium]
MSERKERIEPFRGLFFNPGRAGDLASIVAPPYDLIDSRRQQQLYDRSPYNVVRLELGREQDRYQAAAATLDQWIREGILRRATLPAIYLYTQSFNFEGRDYERNGWIATLRLEQFAAGKIAPHERTFAAAKQDRLQLLSATQANLSSIFGLYPGRHPQLEQLKESVARRKADYAVRDDLGIGNELRAMTDAEEILTVQRELAEVRLLIADGHHRYETALKYGQQRRAQEHDPLAPRPYDYVMITLTSCDDPGLLILPTHRLVHRIDPQAMRDFDRRASELFAIEEFTDPAPFLARLKAGGRGVLGVALAGASKLRILRLQEDSAMATAPPKMPSEVRRLDVSILHALVFERLLGIDEAAVKSGAQIEYTIDAGAALTAVREREAAGAFLMNAPSIADVERVSDAGATMPEKSTYFYPKLLTGLVINPLSD